MSTKQRNALMRKLGIGVNHADGNAPIMPSNTVLRSGQDNPAFRAQFDLKMTKTYYEVTTLTGVAVAVTPTAALRVQIPAYIFGSNDFQANYVKLSADLPVSQWIFAEAGIYKRDYSKVIDDLVDGNIVESTLVAGDLFLFFTSTVSTGGAGVTSLCLVRVNCPNVAYGSLLDALNSNKFVLNQIRYKVVLGQESQFDSEINIAKQSLFGKSGSDKVSPVSFFSPNQQQPNIVDIPIIQKIDMYLALATYLQYATSGTVTWSIYVSVIEKQ